MPDANVFDDELDLDETDPPGYRSASKHITKALGAESLAVKVFLVPPGESLCPYHYEYEEEWLLVLDGEIVLRTPDGERTLGRGDIVAFPSGPTGAHKTSNRSEKPARLLMFSSAREPAVAVYPDSGKIGVWPGNPDDQLILHRTDGNVDYYDGETS